MNEANNLFGPWLIMVILPWLLPIALIVLLILAAINKSLESLKKIHYWIISSLIGLAVYAGIDYLLGLNVLDMILPNSV